MEIEYFVQAGRGRGRAPGVDRRAHAVVRRPRPARARTCASASRRRTSWPTTPSAASTSSTSSRWAGASSRGSPTAPTSTSTAHSRGPENPDAVGELRYFDQEQKKHIVPYVIEPSAGADRATLAFLCDAYDESLVKEPPAEEIAKLRELVAELRQVGRQARRQADGARDEGAPGGRGREDRRRACPGRCRELLALSDDADANRIEVFKKVRGVAEKLGEEFTRTVLRLHPRLAPITVGGLPAEEERAAPGRAGARHQEGAAGRRACAPSTTTRAPSASSTAARTRSARRSASPSTSRAWRTGPSPCAIATRWAQERAERGELRGDPRAKKLGFDSGEFARNRCFPNRQTTVNNAPMPSAHEDRSKSTMKTARQARLARRQAKVTPRTA